MPVRFTGSADARGFRETTNSPVCRMLHRLSLDPTEVKEMTRGSADATVKNECGARLSTLSADREDTQAIGRGMTVAVSHG